MYFRLLITVLPLVLFAGCSDKVSLKGKVTFSDDGSPLTKGIVHFTTDVYVARGVLKPDGSYVVGSLAKKDGLPEGTYKVYIENAEQEIGTDSRGMPITRPLIAAKYASPSTSDMTLTVSRATKRYDFHVDRPNGSEQ